MQKSELKTGMIVVIRDGKVGLVLNDILCGIDWWTPLSFYNDKLEAPRYKFESEIAYIRGAQNDIVEVYTTDDIGITLRDLLNKEKIAQYGKRLL